jgi:hypothetical protein
MSRNKGHPFVVFAVMLVCLLPTAVRGQSSEVREGSLNSVSPVPVVRAPLQLRPIPVTPPRLATAQREWMAGFREHSPGSTAGKHRTRKLLLGAAIGGGVGFFTGLQLRNQYGSDSHASYGPAVVVGAVGAGLGVLIASALSKH